MADPGIARFGPKRRAATRRFDPNAPLVMFPASN
jgi:hypothetical protein